MPQVRYAFRDDIKTISLLVQGSTAACPLCQIVTLRKREIVPDFLDQYIALDIKGSRFPNSGLTEYGRSVEINKKYRKCLVKIDSQIEFTVKPSVMQRMAEFLPAYTSVALFNFFDGQPYGYLVVLQVYETNITIPSKLMEKGRMSSAQIIHLYDSYGEKTVFDIRDEPKPLIEPGIFNYIKDEILHILRLENALVGVYECDDESKRLLRQKRDIYNHTTGQYKHTFNEDDDIDRSQVDYEETYRKIVSLDSSLKEFVDYVRKIKAPQMVEWQTLLPKATTGNKQAHDRLVEMYTRNVLRIALSYAEKFNLPIADTIQDGIIGLIMAINKFEKSGATVFQQYFPLWVRQFIQRKMRTYLYNKYFPIHVHEIMMKIKELAYRQGIDLTQDFDISELLVGSICDELNIDAERARQLLKYLTPVVSLEEMVDRSNEEVSCSNDDIVAFILPDVVSAQVLDKSIQSVIKEILSTLTPREACVMRLRHGFDDGQPKTLEEIGKQFNLSRERIRQIETKALRRLRHPSRSKKMKDLL